MDSSDLRDQLIDILRKNGITDPISVVQESEPEHIIGEHHGGTTCHLVTVQFETTRPHLHLFRKRSGSTSDLMQTVMKKEVQFLTRVLPDLLSFCRERLSTSNATNDELLRLFANSFPIVYHAHPENGIYMEDLNKQGFTMYEKSCRQDYEQARITIQSLARFHAISHMFIKYKTAAHNTKMTFQDLYPEMSNPIYIPQMASYVSLFYEFPFSTVLEFIEKSKSAKGRSVASKLKQLSGNIFMEICDALSVEPSSENLLCINHGDCWNNNLLYGNALRPLVFVDWQAYCVNSLGRDIGQFLFTSAKLNVIRKWRKLLKEYYETFSQTCLSLGGTVAITFEELLQDFREKVKVGYLINSSFFLAMAVGKKARQYCIANGGDKYETELSIDSTCIPDYLNSHPEELDEALELLIGINSVYYEIQGDVCF